MLKVSYLLSYPVRRLTWALGALRSFCTELCVQPCHSTQRDAVRMQLSSLWHTHSNSHAARIWLICDGLSQGDTVLSQGRRRLQLIQRFKVSSGSALLISESGAKCFSFLHGSGGVNCHDTSLWEATFPTLHHISIVTLNLNTLGENSPEKGSIQQEFFQSKKVSQKMISILCCNTKSFTNKNCTGIKIQNVQITTGFLIIVIRIRACVLVSCLFHCW